MMEKKRLVLIGIRKKGDHKFVIISADSKKQATTEILTSDQPRCSDCLSDFLSYKPNNNKGKNG